VNRQLNVNSVNLPDMLTGTQSYDLSFRWVEFLPAGTHPATDVGDASSKTVYAAAVLLMLTLM